MKGFFFIDLVSTQEEQKSSPPHPNQLQLLPLEKTVSHLLGCNTLYILLPMGLAYLKGRSRLNEVFLQNIVQSGIKFLPNIFYK